MSDSSASGLFRRTIKTFPKALRRFAEACHFNKAAANLAAIASLRLNPTPRIFQSASRTEPQSGWPGIGEIRK